jgi:lysozyme
MPNPANNNLEPSQTLIERLTASEGCKLTAYWDVNGFSIGYGHHGPDVVEGTTWTEAQAQAALASDLALVGREVKALVNVPLTQGQFDALTDWTYELGSGRLQHSTLLKLLNAGDYRGAGQQLLAWDMVAGKVNAGVKARREEDFALWAA